MKKLNTILLIDDDQINNYLNEVLLKELGIAQAVKVVLNGKQALEYLLDHCEATHKSEHKRSFCPELIIFDHHMPVMDGMEFIQALNQIGFVNRQEVVFILLAIHTAQEDIEAFKGLGVQEFTNKPLSKEIVMDAYHKYFAGDTAKGHT